ncbi:carbohydrate ABC transporter permease [Glaciibacter superstes]|uniref:carbohydrate ABC transporter permease n=1 Tax=Glaciibacter superstes TaxID=501023 RepID=UPI0004153C4F|nr:carbohydrate ABC transporter permease [Glaciibacter superstes]
MSRTDLRFVVARARRKGNRAGTVRGTIAILAIFAALMLFVAPVAWMFVISVRPADEMGNGLALPTEITFEAFDKVADFGFIQFFANSLIVGVISATISVLLALLAAYGFSRRRFRGRNALLFTVVLSQLFPFVMLVTPLYIIFGQLSLIDSYLGIIIAYVAITLPFSVYMLLGYIDSIPASLDEAAEIDGAGTLRLIFRIILPVAWPGLVASWIYAFTLAWEEYLLASVLLTSPDKRTLPVAMAGLFGEFTTQWDVVMAAGVVATVPTLIIFLILQRRLVGNLAGGSVK